MTDDIVARLRASNFNWDCDEAADEIERLRAALLDISSRHIPDCPALFWGDPVDWAERQHTELRRLALTALEGEKTDDAAT